MNQVEKDPHSPNTCNTLEHQVFGGDNSCLVETENVDAASERNTEGLGTEDGCEAQV